MKKIGFFDKINDSLIVNYYYYEVRTHSTHTYRKTDEQTDRE